MAIQLELKEHLEAIVRAGIESGQYQSAEQVVGTALLAMEQQDAAKANLRVLVEDGFESGYAEDGVVERVRERIQAKAAALRSHDAASV